MWRSFFYALSVGLMALGGQALIFERVTLNPEAKIPSFVQRLLQQNGAGPNFPNPNNNQYAFGGVGQQSGIPNAVGSNFGQRQDFQPPPNLGNSYSGQSRFGPSRFVGPATGGYGGGRVGFGQNSLQRNSQFGQGSTPAQLASLSTPVGNGRQSVIGPAGGRGFRREIITKDWMPWSLMAVGGVIFLYTHTSRRRYSE